MTHTNISSVALRGCLEACDRCLTVLDHVPECAYRGEGEGATAIGPHLRHCLDHITCLLRGQETGEIDYDARERNTRIEGDPVACRAALLEARAGLEELGGVSEDQPVHVIQSCSLGTSPQRLLSTVGRELAFVSSHTIHHLSVIEVICKESDNPLPEGFALAFSTSAYRASRAG